jgi:hypothetical protein
MLTAQVKALSTIDHIALEDVRPEDPECFQILVRAMVGPRDQEGEESFDLKVCTPSWLAKVCAKDGFVLGVHYLIVDHYDLPKIRQLINRFIERCSGDTWQQVAQKVGRLAYWEFEDLRGR